MKQSNMAREIGELRDWSLDFNPSNLIPYFMILITKLFVFLGWR